VLVANGAVAQKDLSLVQFVDTPEEAFRFLKAGLEPYLEAPSEADLEPQRAFTPNMPAPDAQDLLGPDINRTRR
jgi:hypothetical protein